MRIRMGLAIAIAVLVASSAATLAVSGALTTTRAQFQSLAAAGSDVVCGIRTDATLDCWGRAAVSVVDPPPGSYTAVSAARRVACGLRRDASMACWGRWWTEIGADASVHPPSGTFSVVDLAEAQGCAIRTSGALACFGARDQRGSVDDVETIAEGMEGRDIDRYVRETPPLVPPAGTFLDVAAVHDVGGGCAIRTAGHPRMLGRRLLRPGIPTERHVRRRRGRTLDLLRDPDERRAGLLGSRALWGGRAAGGAVHVGGDRRRHRLRDPRE